MVEYHISAFLPQLNTRCAHNGTKRFARFVATAFVQLQHPHAKHRSLLFSAAGPFLTCSLLAPLALPLRKLGQGGWLITISAAASGIRAMQVGPSNTGLYLQCGRVGTAVAVTVHGCMAS
jgi:hypothetical protein